MKQIFIRDKLKNILIANITISLSQIILATLKPG